MLIKAKALSMKQATKTLSNNTKQGYFLILRLCLWNCFIQVVFSLHDQLSEVGNANQISCSASHKRNNFILFFIHRYTKWWRRATKLQILHEVVLAQAGSIRFFVFYCCTLSTFNLHTYAWYKYDIELILQRLSHHLSIDGIPINKYKISRS